MCGIDTGVCLSEAARRKIRKKKLIFFFFFTHTIPGINFGVIRILRYYVCAVTGTSNVCFCVCTVVEKLYSILFLRGKFFFLFFCFSFSFFLFLFLFFWFSVFQSCSRDETNTLNKSSSEFQIRLKPISQSTTT